MDRNNTFSLNLWRIFCVRACVCVSQRPSNLNSPKLSVSSELGLGSRRESEMARERETAENIEIKGNYSCRFVWNSDDLMLPTACKYRAMVERNCVLGCVMLGYVCRPMTFICLRIDGSGSDSDGNVKIMSKSLKRRDIFFCCIVWSHFVCSS